MLFLSYPPSSGLSYVVSYYWTLRSEEADHVVPAYRFVPDGYVDWIFHIGSPWSFQRSGTSKVAPCAGAHVFGQIENAVDLAIPPAGLDVFAVRFKPWVARAFWGADMHCFTNAFTPLADLDVKGPTVLTEQLQELSTTQGRIACVERYLANHRSEAERGEQLIRAFHTDLTEGRVDLGTRRKQQLFRSEVGISPRLLAQTFRFNRTVKKLRVGEWSSLTELAYDGGYYDQSHLIRDFQRFTGMAPKMFLRSIQPSGEMLNLRAPQRSGGHSR
jgi:AraC-like DNA-binding protein